MRETLSERIWKFPLKFTDRQTIVMPSGSRILTAQFQEGDIVLWAVVDPNAQPSRRTIHIIGTGNPCSTTGLAYVATVQEPLRPLVWHVFQS